MKTPSLKGLAVVLATMLAVILPVYFYKPDINRWLMLAVCMFAGFCADQVVKKLGL